MAHDRLTRPYNYIHSNEAPNMMRAFAPWKSAWQSLKAGKTSMAWSHSAKGFQRAFDYFSGRAGGIGTVPTRMMPMGPPVASEMMGPVAALTKNVAIRNQGLSRLKVGGARTLAAYVGLRVAGGIIGGVSDALSGRD